MSESYKAINADVLIRSQLCGARAAYLENFELDRPSFDLAIQRTEAIQRLSLISKDGNYALQSLTAKEFALLDNNSARLLEELRSMGTLRFQATLQGPMPQNKATTKSRRNIIDIAINVYGPIDLAGKLGALLNQKGQFLQHPDAIDPKIKYDNPQHFKTPGMDGLNHLVWPRPLEKSSQAMILSEVGKILDSLDIVHSDWDVPTNDALLTPLLR